MAEQDTRIYIFGDYVLDPSALALFRAAQQVPIGRRSFQVLEHFIHHPDEVVTKFDLLKAVWSDVNVVPNNVDRQVSNLRGVLGRTSAGQEYIITVHGDGYRLAVPVQTETKPEPGSPKPNQDQSGLQAPRPVARWLIGVAVLAVVATLAILRWRETSTTKWEDARTADARQHQAYRSGLEELLKGNVLAARIVLERAVREEPGFGPSHAALSTALLSLGYENWARDEAKKGMASLTSLGHEDGLFVRGQYYESTSNWQQATKVYETLHALAPDDNEWAVRYAIGLSRTGKHKEASEVLQAMKQSAHINDLDLRLQRVEAALAESANQFDTEYKIAEQTEREARSRGLNYQTGHAELSESWALDNLSRYAEAEKKAKDAQLLLSTVGDPGGEGQAMKLLGDAYADDGKLAPANDAYAQAIAIFRTIGWRSGEAVALNNSGYVFRDLGDLQGARALFEQSLAISRASGDLSRQGMALSGVAIVLKRMGNFDGAAEAYSEALEIDQKLCDDGKSATALNNLAIVLQDQGRLAEAKSRLNQALSLFQNIGKLGDVAMAYGNLGDVAIREGNLSEAANRYKSQIELGRKIPQLEQVGYGLMGLGEVYFLRDDLKSARQHLEQSYRLRTKLQTVGTAAETALALAEVDLEENRFAAARSGAESAVSEFQNERQHDQEAVAQAILAEALVGEHSLTAARTALNAAVQLLSSSEDKDSQVNARLHLWKVFQALGRSVEAKRALHSVVVDATQSRYLPQLLEARLFWARLEPAASHSDDELEQIRSEASGRGLFFISKKASLLSKHPVFASLR